jgi:hypothetical protein
MTRLFASPVSISALGAEIWAQKLDSQITSPYPKLMDSLPSSISDRLAATRALLVLFGELPRGGYSKVRLHRRVLRKRYRIQALANHPDRAAVLGVDEAALVERFKRVQESYAYLGGLLGDSLSVVLPVMTRDETADYLQLFKSKKEVNKVKRNAAHSSYRGHRTAANAKKTPRPTAQKGSAKQASNNQADRKHDAESNRRASSEADQKAKAREPRRASTNEFIWRSKMPSRPLSFKQFLFYSGRITFAQLIAATAWQKEQRPRVGQIAKDWGMLTPIEVLHILGRKSRGELFCDAAVRVGVLTDIDRAAVLGKQKQMHKRSTSYFVQNNIISSDQVNALDAQVRRHNWTVNSSN